MELELKKASLDAYEAAGELTLTQEETAETIVPDYCPDIARIIETTGQVYLHSRELRDGRGSISGTVRVSVLYTPEGEAGIRTLELNIPFSAEAEGRGLPESGILLAETETELLEARLLNPRKVFTHCRLVTRMAGYRREPLCFTDDAEAGEELQVEKKLDTQHAVLLTHIGEKDFTFSDQMRQKSWGASCSSKGSFRWTCCTGRQTGAVRLPLGNCLSPSCWSWRGPRREQRPACCSKSPGRTCRSTAAMKRAERSR